MVGKRALFAVGWTALGCLFMACSSGEGGGGGAGSPGTDGGSDAPECTVDAECEDGNKCSIDSCTADRQCEHEAAPDGDAKEQVTGDCMRIVCQNGLAQEVEDTGDIDDDGEQCTLDVCSPTGTKHVPQVDGTKCYVGNGNGECKSGKCLVLCTPDNALTQCDDDNSCTQDACVSCALPECEGQGQCAHTGLSGMPTPGAPQEEGDCHERRCVEGKDEDAIDNYDVPVDGNECTDDLCKDGVPINEPLAAGSACSTDYVCDGNGQCVECVTASDCTTSTSTCYTAACKSGYCSQDYTPSGTPLPASEQQTGDCKTLVCNGSGSTTYQEAPTDLPNDNNPCTDDLCNGSSPTHPKKATGTACGPGGQICTISGTCCAPTSCASQGLTCGTVSDGCGGTLSCGTCTTGDSCSSGKCGCKNGYKSGQETDVDCGGICPTKCNNGQACFAASDCTSGFCVDGVCCNSACSGECSACTSVKTGATTGICASIKDSTDPDNECPNTLAQTCGTTGMCEGGKCAYHPAGTQCAPSSCSTNVETKADTCDGAGICVDNGTVTCGAGYVCTLGKCGSCSDGLKNGAETDVDCGGGGACSACAVGKKCLGGSDCQNGQCVDGYCCNTSCSGLCVACNLSGNWGTCSPIANGSDPIDECAGPKTCNGAGACN